jgi:diguanylate cyclase (GGDEF)-like protein
VINVSVEPSTVAGDVIRALVIDDNASDAELSLLALRRAGMSVQSVVVHDESQLRTVLLSFVPDVVICDFSFPNFDGLEAQRIIHEAFPACPVIFVSGAISEERAAMALQCGAVDYVMKSALVRLPIAVERAVRTARREAEVQKRASGHVTRLETLWGIVNDPELQSTEFVRVMLSQAAADLSVQQRFSSYLCSGTAGHVKIVGRSTAGAPGPVASEVLLALGALGEAVPAGGARTRSWTDVADSPDAPAALARAGWRATIATAFEANGARYWLTFAAGDAATSAFGDDDFAYLDVLAACFANQLRVNALEASLRDQEERARSHASRLEASWQIVNDARLSDAEKWLAVLSQAAGSVWPGHGYRGTLWRIHGDEMTCEAIGEAPGHCLSTTIEVGMVVPVASSTIGLALATGMKSRSWDDLRSGETRLDLPFTEEIRSTIVTIFAAGDTMWGLSFTSGRLTPKPLGNLEHAYVDALASYFSNHVERRWQDARFRFEREHDRLTGLLNRSQFHALAGAASPPGSSYAIAVFNLETFREINESYGHALGDAVLVQVANALLATARSDEIVARIGGDVFAVHLANRSVAYLRARVHVLAGAVARKSPAGSPEAAIERSARVGVAVAPDDGDDIDTILSRADASLAIAKARGPGAIVYYQAGMEGDARLRIRLRNELVEALAQDQFTLFYQPHVEIATGRVVGCEALIRWDHPTRGLVSPFEFIPFAEESGFITSIDDWVMRRALKTAAEIGASRPDFRLYFNLSGRQAGNVNLIRAFVRAARQGVPLRNIGVEITETDAMRDLPATRRVLRALRRLDVRTAIDDFGVGYSSLSSLKQLPVDIVKIDRSFVSGLTNNPDDAAMAETIISIAEHFGFESVGEGAETQAEIEWLGRHGCGYVQGYAICHPLPLDRFRAWLSDYDAKLVSQERRRGAERRRRKRRNPPAAAKVKVAD